MARDVVLLNPNLAAVKTASSGVAHPVVLKATFAVGNSFPRAASIGINDIVPINADEREDEEAENEDHEKDKEKEQDGRVMGATYPPK
jgi:hypothetical protein